MESSVEELSKELVLLIDDSSSSSSQGSILLRLLLRAVTIYYINSGCLCVRLSDTTILHFNSPAEPVAVR
jgi:hypothetical protein